MATGLLLDKRLSVRTLRDSRIVVDEAACTGAMFTTLLNPDGDGKNYRLGTWTTTGLFAVLAAGQAEVLLVGAGQVRASGGYFGGQGARVLEGVCVLPAGVLPVTVGTWVANAASASQLNGWIAGPGGGYGDNGAGCLVDTFTSSPPALPGGWVSRITGTAVEYAQGGTRAATTPGSASNGGTPQNGVIYVRWQI